MVDSLSYLSFQPVFHDWCNKGCGMCYPFCWMVHIKEPMLLVVMTMGFLFHSLSVPLPYVHCHISVNKMCSVLLHKTFHSFFLPDMVFYMTCFL